MQANPLVVQAQVPVQIAGVPAAVAPGSYLTISHIGAEFFPDKAAMAQARAVYERASEPIWARSREEILGFFDGFELLEPGLVPKHQRRSVTGQAGTGTPNIQWGGALNPCEWPQVTALEHAGIGGWVTGGQKAILRGLTDPDSGTSRGVTAPV